MNTSQRFARLGLVGVAMLVLAGCARHNHAAMHAMHHGGMHQGGMMGTAAPTTPARLTTSTPTLSSGYKKVAAPAQAKVYFTNLRNGSVVSNPVKVGFGLSGMGVAPAGVEKEGTGHHHLLIDVAEVDANAPLPANDQFRHFGMGQTETTVELKPGTHTLQLVLGDQNHIPHHPVVISERITITVK
ncbi:DUF4399 domain-containing protein [Hydrogenophaga sp.]|uniref:DUF4399 domain-containing protein n=1 Tax=Hydrogenophaga sp. TaxID=1904254 RepID=UPI002736DB61|nr:DUF4399 domain-containing protein [Hydrogenophaga sp.]MDP2987820.1 DUF4399 domain-containing protein [Hydrogenophaga sp.]